MKISGVQNNTGLQLLLYAEKKKKKTKCPLKRNIRNIIKNKYDILT